MNIFVLSNDAIEAAQAHNDKHVVKMILETAQLLSTAHHMSSSFPPATIYKATHRNHPCAIWVRESVENYEWAHSLLKALCAEYTYRYGKVHKTEWCGIVTVLGVVPDGILSRGLMEFPQCMPDEYRHASAVIAYRDYYKGSKSHIANWKVRGAPEWWGCGCD